MLQILQSYEADWAEFGAATTNGSQEYYVSEVTSLTYA